MLLFLKKLTLFPAGRSIEMNQLSDGMALLVVPPCAHDRRISCQVHHYLRNMSPIKGSPIFGSILLWDESVTDSQGSVSLTPTLLCLTLISDYLGQTTIFSSTQSKTLRLLSISTHAANTVPQADVDFFVRTAARLHPGSPLAAYRLYYVPSTVTQ